MTEGSRPKRGKIGSRSCDACKIRKVKCSEKPPCQRCVATGIECTFNKTQSTRGPRSLRAKTLQQIRDAQQRGGGMGSSDEDGAAWAQQSTPAGLEPGVQTSEDMHIHNHSMPEIGVDALVLRLCIYRLRLFPVWPIVAVEEVIAALQRDADDVETLALAAAVGAATMAQLKLDRFQDGGVTDCCTAASLEAQCQQIRTRLGSGTASLNSLRTSFFLHIYHENQQPGGTKSLLYLREAITLAQIMGLHRTSSYPGLKTAEDRLRRRILWLLFVTERGVAALHQLPVVLTSAEKLPPLESSDSEEDAHILPAFKKLVNLFWIFDQEGAFEILQDAADSNTDGQGGGTPSAMANHQFLAALQQRLRDTRFDLDNSGDDVQKVDICVTRQWMQVLIWRAAWRTMLSNWNTGARHSAALTTGPIEIAQEMLERISQLPNDALEAHGPTLEFKVYEIASAVADSAAIANVPLFIRPRDILVRLQSILATSRGGNSGLLNLLAVRIAQMEPAYPMTQLSLTMPSGQVIEEATDGDDGQGWGVGSAPTGFPDFPPDQEQPARSPQSPWLSLMAAAELEQQIMSCQNLQSEGLRETLPTPVNLRSTLGRYNHHPEQMYCSSSTGPPASCDALGETLVDQPWISGNSGRRAG